MAGGDGLRWEAAVSRQATNCHLWVREGKWRRRERKTEGKKRVKNATLKAGKGERKAKEGRGKQSWTR